MKHLIHKIRVAIDRIRRNNICKNTHPSLRRLKGYGVGSLLHYLCATQSKRVDTNFSSRYFRCHGCGKLFYFPQVLLKRELPVADISNDLCCTELTKDEEILELL